LRLIFVLHNHQPVGNFEHVFERAYEKAYLPFWEMFERAPHVRIGLHVSGPLLDFFGAAHPDFIERIAALVDAERVELLGGGLYEPILTIIPERDAIGQVEAMAERLQSLFGVRPKGMWLAERVWEPEIPALLGPTEIEYTLVDDGLFTYSGIPPEKCEGHWVTECRGHPLLIFPISMKLRYYFPFKPVPMVKELLQELHSQDPDIALTFGDDGEKFGIWPETHEWVYGKNWLEDFFKFLADESDWIKIPLPSEYLASEQPRGRVYLPQASYEEMLEWALPTRARLRFKHFKGDLKRCNIFEQGRPFLRGGTWLNFLAKYPEADWMHKRMVYISGLLPDPGKDRKPAWKEARNHLYKAQCNCAYWHGLFGGVYLNYLRQGVWHNLIAAERIARSMQRAGRKATSKILDINLDGIDEHLLENDEMFIAIAPAHGASAAEIDLRKRDFNLTNVIARREEAFHIEFRQKNGEGPHGEGIKTIHEITKAKVEGLDELLEFDPAPRYSFQDFIPWAILGNAADGEACKVIEWHGPIPGEIQALGPGHFAIETKLRTDEGWLVARITKEYKLLGPSVSCAYGIISDWPGEFGFATQFNLTLLAGHAEDRYLAIGGEKLEPPFMDSVHCIPGADGIELHDDWLKMNVTIKCNVPAESLEISPIITVSSSEEGLEPTYQGTCLSFLRRISHPKGDNINFAYTITATVKD
jgi:hypothetical protein